MEDMFQSAVDLCHKNIEICLEYQNKLTALLIIIHNIKDFINKLFIIILHHFYTIVNVF